VLSSSLARHDGGVEGGKVLNVAGMNIENYYCLRHPIG
jgi:hypothetical protein